MENQECSFNGDQSCVGKLAALQASFDNHDKHVLGISQKIDKLFASIDELKSKNGTMDVAIARLEDNGVYASLRLKQIETQIKNMGILVNANDKRISKMVAVCSALITIGTVCGVLLPHFLKG